MNLDTLLNELDSLGLPADQYAITTSGVLALRGLREANDLDLIVTPSLWASLGDRFRPKDGLIAAAPHIEIIGPHSIVSAFAESQIARSELIGGHPYVQLDDVLDIKRQLGRSKDLLDIDLIRNYQSGQLASGNALPARATGVAGVRYRVSAGIVWIRSDTAMESLSSAVRGGGFQRSSNVLNVHVDRTYHSNDPAGDLDGIAAGLGIGGEFVGLLTAVYVEKAALATRRSGDIKMACIATAGIGNATCAGREVPCDDESMGPGTINIVLITNASLEREAMVNMVITATEAKSLALADLGVRTAQGLPASGTSTDAIVICTTSSDRARRYAGPSTLIGHLAAVCVREAVTASLRAEAPRCPSASPIGAI